MNFSDQVDRVHQSLLTEGGIEWGDLEERVLQFHLGNIEFSCGSKMDDVSCLYSCVIAVKMPNFYKK